MSPRRQRLKSAPAQALVDDFVHRCERYTPARCAAYETEAAVLAALDKAAARGPAALFLLDSRGATLTSEAFAEHLRTLRDGAVQQAFLAVGPADGWSGQAWSRATLRVAFGAITLPHELALVIAAEQTYRALTILAGHPYHSGHS